MTAQGYPNGYDVMWAASDRDGRIGLFFSGGCGPIPKSFLEYEGYEQEDLEAYMLDLPERGASIAASGQGLINEEKLARAGCYVFDWSDVHRVSGFLESYELFKMPSVPLLLADLSPDVRGLLTAAALPNVAFGGEMTLDVEMHCQCLHETRGPSFDYPPARNGGQLFREFRLDPSEKDSALSIMAQLRRLIGRRRS